MQADLEALKQGPNNTAVFGKIEATADAAKILNRQMQDSPVLSPDKKQSASVIGRRIALLHEEAIRLHRGT
jgi:hypothetical protein